MKTKDEIKARVEARKIAKKIFGNLTFKQIVHHVDGNCLNNLPENLIILTRKQHALTHSKINKLNGTKRHIGTRSRSVSLQIRITPELKKRVDDFLQGTNMTIVYFISICMEKYLNEKQKSA